MPGYTPRYYPSGGRSSRRNYCPDGFAVDTAIMEVLIDNITPQNITFLVCNPKSDNSDSLELGLGLGLGIWIPVLIISFIIWYVSKYGCYFRICTFSRNNIAPHTKDDTLTTLFERMGSKNHRDWIIGNLTEEVKDAINKLSDKDLNTLKQYAIHHTKRENELLIMSIQVKRRQELVPLSV